MPQPIQNSLVQVLLLWTTVLSIFQIVVIALFFAGGHNGPSQNSSAVEPQHKMQSQEPKTSSFPSDNGYVLGKGKMVTFKATEDNSSLKWTSLNPDTGVISKEGKSLTILRDGYYFLSLRVTLSLCKGSQSEKLEHKVHLMWQDTVLLEGWINTKTNSTGVLSKVKELSAGGTLEVRIIPPATCIQDSEAVTHLDIIYMAKP
ncbi:uncharacterized protein LOC114440571 isoform X2 [Parambassis ranga]|uniref:Uncharacterized protein LOC114440571 isoform X2 n=1 Tax=Parambassis ranga TaxID=210632 RepID=A0A6P7ITW4_9TELE|nr:uncharacterized protein LOC114440571 isoform X2 [Parambassis ranga]